jgi:hypothetical protein
VHQFDAEAGAFAPISKKTQLAQKRAITTTGRISPRTMEVDIRQNNADKESGSLHLLM